MAKLGLDGLTKTFGSEITAVSNLSITVDDGEFLVLVGPSGCGKSTTLDCIAGLQSPTEGQILIDGEVVNEKQPQARNIAMVFQNYALYPNMTARRNMSFGLEMSSSLSSDEISERVTETAETMGISDLLEDQPKELSGGQKQRVALGRAIVRQPDVFLLDEPLSNLDAKLRSEMRTEIQSIQSELDVTTVYVTHDQTEAMTMGDRIAILQHGQLRQIGTPLECYYNPQNRFVAEFIGEPSMNFFTVQAEGNRLTGENIDTPIPEQYTEMVSERDRLTLGVRPDPIKLVSPGEGACTGTVRVIEPVGEDSYVYVDVAGNETIASVPVQQTVQENDTVGLDFPDERVHLFDTDSGEALMSKRDLPDAASMDSPRLKMGND